MYCFYHSSDFDGHCSGAIVKYKYPEVNLKAIDYSDEFDFNLIEKNDTIFMVDFSLKPDDMLKLKDMCDLIWIDHHKSAIEYSKEYNYSDISGIRDLSKAACELTWFYLNNHVKMPQAVHLLGRYDVWDLFKFPNILEFQNGLKIFDTNPENQGLWKKLFDNSSINDINVEKIIEIGKYIIQYKKQESTFLINRDGFLVKFHNILFLVINRSAISSQFFENYKRLEETSIRPECFLAFYYNGINKKWIYSMYKLPNSEYDILSIAKEYGGGGHASACGFTSENSFNQLLFLNDI
jgi:oligoribonuclease NrnB/cAMP/cGMP phosphodiesterase (DHH superfamily)